VLRILQADKFLTCLLMFLAGHNSNVFNSASDLVNVAAGQRQNPYAPGALQSFSIRPGHLSIEVRIPSARLISLSRAPKRLCACALSPAMISQFWIFSSSVVFEADFFGNCRRNVFQRFWICSVFPSYSEWKYVLSRPFPSQSGRRRIFKLSGWISKSLNFSSIFRQFLFQSVFIRFQTADLCDGFLARLPLLRKISSAAGQMLPADSVPAWVPLSVSAAREQIFSNSATLLCSRAFSLVSVWLSRSDEHFQFVAALTEFIDQCQIFVQCVVPRF